MYRLPRAFMLIGMLLVGCNQQSGMKEKQSAASPFTQQANADMVKDLDLNNNQDFDDAKRGFIARPTGKLLAADGSVLIDYDAFNFVSGEAPATVNASLWRHARLNAQIGLFKVTDGVHQLRGFDVANMTLIDGASGWIVVDPLTSTESAAAALAFARQHLGNKPVSAIIFTHSHIDHFGGALGVATAKQAVERALPVIAPEGFMEEATSENILVGTAMSRRSIYQFGKNLPRSVTGMVDTGLGKGVVYGTFGILPPTLLITQPDQDVLLDGLHFRFHNVPGAEAPSELTFGVTEYKAYFGAENLAQTLHNLLPIRGAKVRNALLWSSYLDQALVQAADAEVYVGQHNWPIWGSARIAEFITKQRDAYKYMHDQTVRLINAGYTPREIADTVKMPKSLASYFGARGYYGDVRHNVKAVYQFYIGAYDGNPANLNPLPPKESAVRYVALMGGADKTITAAQAAYDKGEYRWVAELLNLVVFAEPENAAAKELLAQTYDQLGYMSEASTWRNSYLTAADELRHGGPKKGISSSNFIDVLAQTPPERFFEAMAAGLDGPAADGKNIKVNLIFSDNSESYVLWIENSVLHYKKAAPAADANASLTLSKDVFIRMMAGTAGIKETLLSDEFKVQGSRIDLMRFFSLIDKAPGDFAIVTD